MADANDPKYDYGVNDLPLDACKQASTYGHISNALDSLGPIAKEARQIYVDNGDIDDAVRYVKEQYYISHISEF